jgi:lipopolysaccharide biosynthesis glycosyltransferase
VSDSTVVLAATIDDAHAIPLLVTVRSACRSLSAGWTLQLFVIGFEISAATRDRFESHLAGFPVRVEWLTTELDAVRPYWPAAETAGRITLYYRLYLGDILPADVHRVLFLDADILVRGDLAKLWRLPFDGATAQAVPDAYAKRVHLPRLSVLDSGDGSEPASLLKYFNAGVLLIHLDQWRRKNVGGQAAEFLWRFGGRLAGRDQDALNLALANDWKPLPTTWNFHEIPSALATRESAGSPAEELRDAIRDPAMVHFIGCNPWSPECRHMHRDLWRNEAAAVGLSVEKAGSWFRRVVAPRHDLDWLIRRRLFQARDLSALGAIAGLTLSHPWLLLTYPTRTFRLWLRRQFQN